MLSAKALPSKLWFTQIYESILAENNIVLDTRRAEHNENVFRVLSENRATVFDVLHVLNLFRSALSLRHQFFMEGKPMTTTELFYASAIIGLKIHDDITDHDIIDIHQYLPATHPYAGNIKKSALLERSFLTGLGWHVHIKKHEAYKRLYELMKNVSTEGICQIACNVLMLKNLGTGDSEAIEEVITRLYPAYLQKSTEVNRTLTALPLLWGINNNQELRSELARATYQYLKSNEVAFVLGESLVEGIKKTIRMHYILLNRSMTQTDETLLAKHLTPLETEELIRLNLLSRLQILSSGLRTSDFDKPNIQAAYNKVVAAIQNSTDPFSLFQIFDRLVYLKLKGLFTHDIFNATFTNIEDSQRASILYTSLCKSNLLSLINQSDTLSSLVSFLIITERKESNNLILDDIRIQVEKFYIQNPPSYRILCAISNNTPAALSDALAQFSITKQLLNLGEALHMQKKDIDSAIAIFKHHAVFAKEDSLSILYALENLKQLELHLSISLFKNLIRQPHHIKVITGVITQLHFAIKNHNLLFLLDYMPDLYTSIYNTLVSNSVSLKLLHLFFGTNNDSRYQLDSIPEIKKDLMQLISNKVKIGNFRLSEYELENLKQFCGGEFFKYKKLVIPANNIALLRPVSTLFSSPETASPAKAPLEEMVGYKPI